MKLYPAYCLVFDDIEIMAEYMEFCENTDIVILRGTIWVDGIEYASGCLHVRYQEELKQEILENPSILQDDWWVLKIEY